MAGGAARWRRRTEPRSPRHQDPETRKAEPGTAHPKPLMLRPRRSRAKSKLKRRKLRAGGERDAAYDFGAMYSKVRPRGRDLEPRGDDHGIVSVPNRANDRSDLLRETGKRTELIRIGGVVSDAAGLLDGLRDVSYPNDRDVCRRKRNPRCDPHFQDRKGRSEASPHRDRSAAPQPDREERTPRDDRGRGSRPVPLSIGSARVRRRRGWVRAKRPTSTSPRMSASRAMAARGWPIAISKYSRTAAVSRVMFSVIRTE